MYYLRGYYHLVSHQAIKESARKDDKSRSLTEQYNATNQEDEIWGDATLLGCFVPLDHKADEALRKQRLARNAMPARRRLSDRKLNL